MTPNRKADKAALTAEMKALKAQVLELAKRAYAYDKQHTNDDTPKKNTGLGALELMLGDLTEEVYEAAGYFDDEDEAEFKI